ncbi:MAG: cation diffusion facilitator family transporter [Coriobacteriia bacterium]|nr:cation diffusion facilitator family transporter [Coriobacteriia bacterium]
MGYTKHSAGTDEARTGRVKFVLWVILFLNLGVAAAKVIWGTLSGSVSMQADGFHSTFDGLSNVVGLVGMSLASRPADDDHPYGHPKYETYASAVIGAMLLLAAWRVGSEAVDKLIHPGAPPVIGWQSFAIMFGTLAVNFGVTMWERYEGKKLRSDLLIADASHTGSDMLVSSGVIVGLVLVKYFNLGLADPIIALLVALAIVYTAWGVFKQASDTLSDSARIPVEEICAVALAVPGVLGCHGIRTRGTESLVYVDMHVQVDAALSVAAGHEVAEAVERTVAERFEQVGDVIVHLEPLDEYQQAKTASAPGEPVGDLSDPGA